MSDFLDRLAMEVSSWTASGFHKAGMQGEDYLVLPSESWESSWLQRRKELINEPDDKDAPKWAGWVAQDSCGKWFWYEKKPTVGDGVWDDSGWQGTNNGKIPAGHDWKTTLKEVHQMDDLKEHPHAELLRLAAEEDNFEYYREAYAVWKPISVNSLVIDTLMGKTYKWRVKPKAKIIKQWERKRYDQHTGLVHTSVSSEPLDAWPSEGVNWVSGPKQVTYEVHHADESESTAKDCLTVEARPDLLLICTLNGYDYYCEDSDPCGEVDWHDAKQAAKDLGEGWEVPNRIVSLLMYENEEVRKTLRKDVFYWTSRESSSSHAWHQDSCDGAQYYAHKAYDIDRCVRPVLRVKATQDHFADGRNMVAPEGWQLVPIEPTEDQICSAMEASVLGRPSVDDESYVMSIINAYLENAPKHKGAKQ